MLRHERVDSARPTPEDAEQWGYIAPPPLSVWKNREVEHPDPIIPEISSLSVMPILANRVWKSGTYKTDLRTMLSVSLGGKRLKTPGNLARLRNDLWDHGLKIEPNIDDLVLDDAVEVMPHPDHLEHSPWVAPPVKDNAFESWWLESDFPEVDERLMEEAAYLVWLNRKGWKIMISIAHFVSNKEDFAALGEVLRPLDSILTYEREQELFQLLADRISYDTSDKESEPSCPLDDLLELDRHPPSGPPLSPFDQLEMMLCLIQSEQFGEAIRHRGWKMEGPDKTLQLLRNTLEESVSTDFPDLKYRRYRWHDSIMKGPRAMARVCHHLHPNGTMLILALNVPQSILADALSGNENGQNCLVLPAEKVLIEEFAQKWESTILLQRTQHVHGLQPVLKLLSESN